jgi:hypothetical protein
MTQENHTLEVIQFPQPAPSFKDAIEALEKKHTGAHTALRETLRDIHAIYLAEIVEASGNKLTENKRILDEACDAEKIKTSDQTTDLHKIVKLITKADPQLGSGYVHVLSVAHALGKTSGNFLNWLTEAGGIEAVRKKYLANGSDNPNYTSGSARKKKREENLTNARHALQTPRITIDATILASANFDQVKTLTECVAIVVRRTDGSVDIMDFVSDKALLDDAYLQYAVEQSEKPKSDVGETSDATTVQPNTSTPPSSTVDELAAVAQTLIAS